ncbi:trans-sulfuration enzyme family protein [Calderihabitans maritimus]|uniref:Cystathionine beta-lyases/cystathionine gamma-synthases n=1 Tax=Calderihabitans maritimus TaxID=1246530 RepID=A0A1Z5HVW6_9FIRM|nr:PLP-dependent aspartate aminotransferase family protein [Calderihabitans maritimus]GAW93689.1 cystathionine beta-lyases/cystathionine gamma-synthases [Calderihabitans maritimus]
MKIDTRLVQVGVGWDEKTGAISMPIYQSATFRHPALGQSTGFDYSRTGNPTRQVLEDSMAELDGGSRGFAFASGMAAITAILMLFSPGDHLVVSDDLYGGTYRVLEQVFRRFGLKASYVDTSDLKKVEEAIEEKTKALFIETPTNPLLKITDISRGASLAQRYNLLTIVDNTFMTPYLQKPLELGADIVVYSATKYLGGHNDLVGGIVVVKNEELAEKMFFIQNSCGMILGPQDCWLLLRGLKTLGVRMDRHQQNALEIARWLKEHPLVEKVYYPGLPEHPGYELCLRQAAGWGGMLSFTVKDAGRVEKILSRLKIISFAESLGGVESLITYPVTQTHADIPEEMRLRAGVTDKLLRLSVGLEAADDLIEDLSQAME